MAYRIVTDTACDFPNSMYTELGLTVAPLILNFRGREHTEVSETFLKEMYNGLRQGEEASTAAVNPEGWRAVMEPILAAGEDVLVMAFSSGLSTTYQSAVITAEELMEQYPQRKALVVDTLCASMGQGLLVYHACKNRDAGMSLEELAQWCEDHKQNLCHFFTVDDLMHLKRGGRVSAATALVGTMLQIKPVLHVSPEGKLVNISKARGRKASLEALCKKVDELALDGARDLMFLSHGDCLEDAEYVVQTLKTRYGVKEVIVSYVGAVIGSHSGPGTVALFFLGQHR